MDTFLEIFGRCHPLLLHLPIGLVFGILVLEAVALARGESLQRGNMGVLVFLASFLAVVTAGSGWLLASGGEYGGEGLERHRWFGLGVAGCALVFGLAHRFAVTHLKRGGSAPAVALSIYGVFLVATTALLVPTGHLGAEMTHGPGFLTAPLRGDRSPQRELDVGVPVTAVTGEPTEEIAVPPTEEPELEDVPVEVVEVEPEPEPESEEAAPAGATFATHIAPILTGRCGKCHGETRQKGGLKLTTIEGLREGGFSGPLFESGHPERSELILRMRLPLEHEDHMPPENKPQPTEDEVRRLEEWIRAGAPFEDEFALGAAILDEGEDSVEDTDAEPASLDASETPALAAAPDGPPEPTALDALTEAFVHVAPISPDDPGLWVDFAAIAAKTDDELAAPLLEPLLGHVAELGLARTEIGASTLERVARMPRLARLDLRSTKVDSETLRLLAGHPSLRTLVLSDTRVDAAAVDTLLTLPALERVYLWRSAVGPCAVERLSLARPALVVDDGTHAGAPVLERDPLAEEEEGESTSASLEPVNATCPVSGGTLDERFRVVHEGRVVGFCCEKCPTSFWEDPTKYVDELP